MPVVATADPAPPARDGGHLYWVDLLRFLAAATVVADHTRMLNWTAWQTLDDSAHPAALCAFLSLTQLGRQAVVVFFVLSGLLVGGKIVARVRRGTFDPAAYAADRAARIYVPLVPALGLTAAVVAVYGGVFYPWDYLGCLAGLQGVLTNKPSLNMPLWTLAYETWFYVLGGCVGAACVRGWQVGKRLAAGAGAVIAVAILCGPLNGTYLLCWLLGAGGFVLSDWIKKGRGWLAVVGALVAVGGMAAYQMDVYLLPPLPEPFPRWMPSLDGAQVMEAAGTAWCVACLIRMRPRTRAAAWLERLGTRLAASSYTLYLTHLPVLYLLAGSSQRLPAALTPASVGRALAWMATAGAAAWGLYVLFEARTPAVRRWLRGTKAAARPAAGRLGEPSLR